MPFGSWGMWEVHAVCAVRIYGQVVSAFRQLGDVGEKEQVLDQICQGVVSAFRQLGDVGG